MRLIDADALTEFITDYKVGRIAKTELLWYLSQVPTVPVVRCKDCRNYRLFKNRFGIEISRCILIGADVGNEAFCSYGERKDGDGDGRNN